MIDSSDIISKSNMILERMYFDGLTDSEQKIMLDKVMISYTKNKLGTKVNNHKNYQNIIDLFYEIDNTFEDEETRCAFYNNYIKFMIGLMGKKQKMTISWDMDEDIELPRISSRFSYGIIDKITTGSKVDPLLNLNYIYNLYMTDMKSYENDETYNIKLKKLAI